MAVVPPLAIPVELLEDSAFDLEGFILETYGLKMASLYQSPKIEIKILERKPPPDCWYASQIEPFLKELAAENKGKRWKACVLADYLEERGESEVVKKLRDGVAPAQLFPWFLPLRPVTEVLDLEVFKDPGSASLVLTTPWLLAGDHVEAEVTWIDYSRLAFKGLVVWCYEVGWKRFHASVQITAPPTFTGPSRLSPMQRAGHYSSLLQSGILTVNQVRRAEGFGPVLSDPRSFARFED